MIYKTISLNGKQIHYQDEGQGDKVLVLLHGFLNSLEIRIEDKWWYTKYQDMIYILI